MLGMAGYYYPPTYYFSQPPYNLTHLSRTFPEHHLPFEHTWQSISHGLHNALAVNEQFPSMKADVRETLHNYYIDVEIPGIESQEHLKLKWTNASTLLVEATKERKMIPETADEKNPVHQLVSERHVGCLIRALDFPVPVNREGLTAKLQYGLLSVVVPKAEDAKVQHVEVPVEHTGS